MELVGNSDCTLSNDKVIVMGLEARGGKRTCPNLKYSRALRLEGLIKNLLIIHIPAKIRAGYLSTTSQKLYYLIQFRRLMPSNFVSCYKHFGRTYCLRHEGSTCEMLVPLYQTTRRHFPEHYNSKAFCFTCRLAWPIDYPTFCWHVFCPL